jgi:dienelactone hydrolase
VRRVSQSERRRFRLVRVAAVAAAAPFVRAGAAGAAFVARVAAAERRGEPVYPDVPNPAPSLTLAAAVALDELVRMPMGILASTASREAYEDASSELDEAVRFYDANGWLDEPDGYFVTPSAPVDVSITTVGRRRGAHEVLRFESGYEPHPGEPGRDRWLSFDANRDVHATMLRHPDGPRPWVVCIHGQGMGRHTDLEFFRLRRMHRELGVNVLLPVLPLHGPRREGRRPEQTFVSGVYPVNNALGLAQSVWDLRRILAWLRQHEGATSIGVYGFSLGSYVGSLLSTVDGDLACVVSVVPTGDLAEALRTSEPGLPSKRRAHRSLHDLRSALVHRVVSPVARPCQVPKDRRFIIAGQGDRIAVPTGAALLWRHWEEPAIEWRPRGHLTTARSAAYDDHLYGIMQASGLATRDAVDLGGEPVRS